MHISVSSVLKIHQPIKQNSEMLGVEFDDAVANSSRRTDAFVFLN